MSAQTIQIRDISEVSDTKKNSDPEKAWSLEPHICRKCFGRLVSAALANGSRAYRCTNCGTESEATEASAVCCCGIKIRKPGRGKTINLVDAGVRCIPNPNRSAQFPAEIVASEVKR